jgi:cytochrome c oxidase subunit 2
MTIDDDYIRESLVDPLKHIAEGYTPIMPSYGPVLKDKDIDNLIAYIKALK